MARVHSTEDIRAYLLTAIDAGHSNLANDAGRTFGITRQAVNRHLRALVAQGVIRAVGTTRARRYELVAKLHRKNFPLDGSLSEDRPWREFVRPLLDGVSEDVLSICQYGLTEMLNNAIDHSGGTTVTVSVRNSPVQVELGVMDDGVGIFRKIQNSLGLADEQHAVLELTKGKLTTDPQRHSGEGIFFTSRVFDRFGLMSGALYLAHSTSGDRDWLLEAKDPVPGTSVHMWIDSKSTRTLREVFDRFSSPDHYRFTVTHVPVALASVGSENLVSRSQARRLVVRLDLFDEVLLDFEGVPVIGQAFADEVFRVFANEHPNIKLKWINANQEVEAMIRRATAERDLGRSQPADA